MTYRSQRDETDLSPVEILAWEIVLPYMFVPIIDDDYSRARDMTRALANLFTEEQLQVAADTLSNRRKK